MTNEERKERNEQKKHQRVNEKYAHTLLFKDHANNFSELLPYGEVTQDDKGANVMFVCSPCGSKFWKHTILTEETTQIEAHRI